MKKEKLKKQIIFCANPLFFRMPPVDQCIASHRKNDSYLLFVLPFLCKIWYNKVIIVKSARFICRSVIVFWALLPFHPVRGRKTKLPAVVNAVLVIKISPRKGTEACPFWYHINKKSHKKSQSVISRKGTEKHSRQPQKCYNQKSLYICVLEGSLPLCQTGVSLKNFDSHFSPFWTA